MGLERLVKRVNFTASGRNSAVRDHNDAKLRPVPDWPLVGRANELRALRDLLLGPDRRGVVLAGPPGVGKTRLGHEAVDLAERAGMATAEVSASRSAAQLPFGAFAPLLPTDTEGPTAGADDLVDLLRRSVAALAERADGRPLLLFVDDAHLLDDASATLLHQAATTGAATVVATVVTGEAAPDPVVALWKDELVVRLDVEPLGTDDIDALLASVLGSVDPAAAVQFAERSRGNVLFLRELMMGALADGNLHDEGAIWQLQHDLEPSTRLVEIVEARLGRLDGDERSLVELVAYGEPLGQAELAELSDVSVAEGLERRDLLASHVDGRRLVVHLAHPLYGDVVRARTPALRARTITATLADAVEATEPTRHTDVLRVATWRLVAGGGRPDLLFEGATIARWRYDFALAEDLAAAALDAGAGFDAALLHAQVVSLQGRRGEAEAALAALAEEAGDDSARGRVAVARFDNALGWLGSDDLQILDDAEDTIIDPEWRDTLESRRLAILVQAEGPRAAVEAALPLFGRASGDALAFACRVGGYALARLGRIEPALETADRGEVASESVPVAQALYPWWHTVTRCEALAYAGRLDEAEEIRARHHAQALEDGSTEAQAAFATLSAAFVTDRGRVQTAVRRAREAVALNLQLGRMLLVRQDRIAAALALALTGDADAARAEVAEVEGMGLPHAARAEVDLLRARAWTEVAGGDIPAGVALLHEAVELAFAIGDRVGASTALHGIARLGRAGDVCERLAKVAQQIDGTLAPARAAHALALADRDAAALVQVSEEFEAMGADLLAAEASADAAVVLRQAGEAREASAAERRTGILVDRCEGPVTPALQATEARARLTPAERDTAVLAAAGRSNKEIAEELILSPRTVENRLQRVYEKLGISGRTEVAEALAIEE
jgi:DNA-binding NarL/FixJ family response regulator